MVVVVAASLKWSLVLKAEGREWLYTQMERERKRECVYGYVFNLLESRGAAFLSARLRQGLSLSLL